MTSDLQDIPDGHKPFGLKTTQPLPPSVAELRDIIAAHYRGDALNQLCALASRAEPAPVADEAAIADLLKRIDKATERVVNNHACMRIPVDMSDVDVVLGDCANVIRSITRRAAPRNDDKLRKLREWLIAKNRMVFRESIEAWSFEDHVGPDGVVKEIDKLLAESPAGDAGESEARGLLKEAMGAFEPWVRGPGVVGGILHLQEEVGNLRARLQAAEAERDALAKERDWERHEWPKQIAAALHTEVGTIGATPSMVATAVQLEHEAHTRCLDRLVKAQNDLAAAKAEGARAAVRLLENVREKLDNNTDFIRDCGLPNGIHAFACRVHNTIEGAIQMMRSAAPATVRQGDEVLRAFLARDDSCGGPTLDESVMRELCRRALEGET